MNDHINAGLEDILKKQEEESRAKIAAGTDHGHKQLIDDLEHVLTDAKNCEFHDFLNEKYAMPKMALIQELEQISRNAKNGDYDNDA